MKVKFAHLADCHLGAWRNDKLNNLGYLAFERAIDKIIAENVDFVIISGDLFDVSNPNVDIIDLAVRELKKLKDNNVPVYGIMGSHDFSPSDKSMLRPLITAELFIDVSQGKTLLNGRLRLEFTIDPKTSIKITGLRARKRSLEIEDYHSLDREYLENESGIKLYVLHTMLNELKPIEFTKMESAPKSLLPSNFDYYAGGHLHKTVPKRLREKKVLVISEDNNIVYPGALSPTNFRELEKYKFGGFCIISGDIDLDSEEAKFKANFIPIKIRDVLTIDFNCDNKTVLKVQERLKEKLEELNVKDKIVTMRIYGTLSSGKTYEININDFTQLLQEKGAYEVLVNKVALSSKEYASVKVPVGKTNEEIENILIKEHSSKTKIKNLSDSDIEKKVHQLLEIIGQEREEGTKVKDYNNQMIKQFYSLFELTKTQGDK